VLIKNLEYKISTFINNANFLCETKVNQFSKFLNSAENFTFEQKNANFIVETTVNQSSELLNSAENVTFKQKNADFLTETTINQSTNDKALQIIKEFNDNTDYNIHLSKNLCVLKNIDCAATDPTST
jgi:hypothetical protein